MRMGLLGRLILAGWIGWVGSSLCWAQNVYRIVGADGRVTFSDKPPAQGEGKRQTLGRTPSPSAGPTLPFELRQIVARYPVVLHSGNNCAPCTAGRAFLSARGIPFTEKTVTTAEDSQALERLSGEAVLPLLLIGNQQIKGFSATEWTQYLNAAGYPATSRLPAGFQPAAPLPMAEVPKNVTPATPVAANPGADNASPPPPPQLPASSPALPANIRANPAGIQF